MNIILGEVLAESLRDRYTVLTLDTFTFAGSADQIKSFCVIEHVSIAEIPKISQWYDLHENLVINYGKRNWNYCEQAIEHLMGKWNGRLDSFYQDLGQRVANHKELDPGPDWSPVIKR